MITGSLYNPKRLYPNKANQYLSGFVSQTPNRQGSNSILFNDTNGKEQIEMTTTGNKIETIEKDHTVNIDGTQKVTIGQNQETTINESQHTHIKQNQETKVEGSQITKVTGDVKITSTEGSIELYSKKTSIIESDDSVYLNAKKKIVLRAGTGITLKVGGNHITLDPASLTTFPMMGMSGEVPPFASVSATKAITEDPIKAENTETPALKINPNNMYWPPYNFLAKDGEKEIKVEYTQDVVEATVLAPEEWREFFQAIDITKNVGGAIKDTYDAIDTAKKLGGLGVTAYVKTHNGVDYLILKGYKQHLKTLLAGTRFKASNPQVVKMGLGALNSAKGMARYVKVSAPIEILVGSSINVLQYILDDEYTLKQLGVDEAKLLVNSMVVAGVSLGVGAFLTVMSIPITVVTGGVILVASSFAVWFVDSQTDFEEKLINAVLEEFE